MSTHTPARHAGTRSFIRVGTLEELKHKQIVVVRGADRPIAVFHNDGNVRAVDNRCPHMGFPLHRGSVKDGMITCHWHHARFDACSGCTFDLWADDVEPFDVQIRGDEVFVSEHPRARDVVAHAHQRLREGLEQNIPLIVAKAILALRSAGVEDSQIVREIALFGSRYRDGWAMGLTVLTAMANLSPRLTDETAYLALYQGARRVAADCAGEPPRRDRHRLETDDIPRDTLQRWLCYWTLVRHRNGAERTLLTAIEGGASKAELTDLIFTAATERFYADSGHLLDFCNKALELLELVGFEHAGEILPLLSSQLVSARGGEETNAWRHPTDLVPIIKDLSERLPALFEQGESKSWSDEDALAQAILGEDPHVILQAIADAIVAGAQPSQLGKALAYAAAMRIAHFGSANEISDWVEALHTFTYCNALHKALTRGSSPAMVRGILHGAMSVYLDRFLNVPPAKLPGDRGSLDHEPHDAQQILKMFLDTLNTQHQVDRAASLVARYLSLNHPIELLLDTLAQAVVREDANFHTLQMLEAGIAQFDLWPRGSVQARNMLIAVARYVAAHSPTQRSQLQTARIALRLHRGEDVYES